MGSGARQHAVARRSRADGRDRAFRDAVARDGRAARPRRRVRARRLAQRRRSAAVVEAKLAEDRAHAIKAVLRRAQRDLDRRHQPHSRRSGRRSTAPGIRRCSWSTRSPRSRSIDYRHDEWGVDVTVAGSQKGLMLPPGLSFNAVSDKALAASKQARLPRSYWRWDEMIAAEQARATSRPRRRPTCSTACTRRSTMLREEGLADVFARHAAPRRGDAARGARRGASRSCAAIRPSTADR